MRIQYRKILHFLDSPTENNDSSRRYFSGENRSRKKAGDHFTVYNRLLSSPVTLRFNSNPLILTSS